MTVDCPGCAARYRLPERLLGSAGARVRCPRCGEGFVVAPTAADVAAARETPRSAGRPGAGAANTPTVVRTGASSAAPDAALDAALDALAAHGPSLAEAAARGRLFAEHGSSLCDAFDDYIAAGGDAKQFRAALERRHAVTLPGCG